ncbi:MAG: DUF1493 family protein [Terriglobales bacterium]
MAIREDVAAMVAEAAGVDASAIGLEIELWYDLRLGGDDMLNLFLNLQKTFSVNLDGLHLPTYCPNEDDVLPEQSAECMRKRLRLNRKKRYESLRVSDLVAAAESGSWSQKS